MSFTKKALAASFSLSQGQFQGGGNSTTITGLRMSARITTPGGEDAGNLELAIYGMSLSAMSKLTLLPFAMTAIGQNFITLMAGDAGSTLSTVFNGTINLAYVDATNQPQVCFRVFAIGGHLEKIKPVPAFSAPGTSDVADVMGQLAKTMGRTLENSGVDVKLQNVNLPGAALQQVAALARHAGVEWTLEDKVLAIWLPGQSRQGAPTIISPATGMVGYPAFTAAGIIVTTEFQGTLKFGTKITVQSELQQARGDWFVTYMEFALDCMVPHGAWFATLQAGKIGVGDNG